jgi:hypothetical protein
VGDDDERRPWAEVFDLILSQYPGYTDEMILDLSLARINQMVDVIVRRRIRDAKDQIRAQAQLTEAAVKTMGAVMMNLAQTSKAQKAMGRMLESVSFNLDGEKKAKELPSTAKVTRLFGVRQDGLIGVRE